MIFRKYCTLILASFLVTLGGFSILTRQAFAVGLAPAPLQVKGILNNTEITKQMTILRANPSADERAHVSTVGDYGRFIGLPEDGIVLLPKGERQVQFDVRIRPTALPSGMYEVPLNMALLPPEQVQSGVNAVALGVGTKIIFEVTDQEEERYSFTSIRVDPTEVNFPLSVGFDLNNEGNVEAKPERVSIKVLDLRGELHFEKTWTKADIPPTPPLTINNIALSTDHSLSIGQYDVLVDIFGKSPDAVTSKQRIEVYPAGTLAQSLEIAEAFFDPFQPKKGDIAVLHVRSVNTGDTPVKADIRVNVKHNSVMIGQLKGTEIIIPPGKEYVFEIPTDAFDRYGDYVFAIYANYGIKRTPALEKMLTIARPLSWYVLILGCVIGLLLLIVVSILVLRRMGRRKR